MVTAIVTSKGQIVIPSEVRRRLNIKKGTRLCVIEKDDGIILKPLTSAYFEQAAGILKAKGKRFTALLLKERRKDKKSEDKE